MSQTGTEVWVTFASFEGDYVKYLKGEEWERQSFLRMQRYGPCEIADADDMAQLARVIVAFVMRARDGW